MTPHIHQFLKAVLGDEATKALKKAADRSETLSTVLGARAIVGWLDLASRWGYEGEVPGLAGSYFRFAKSQGDYFEGEVRLGKNAYEFKGVDLPHVAAGLSVALGADQAPDEDLRDAELSALGDNIDLLLKMQVLKSMTKAEDDEPLSEDQHSDFEGTDCDRCKKPIKGTSYSRGYEDDPDEVVCSSCYHGMKKGEDLEKAGGTTAPGEAAPQKPPAGPVGGGFTAPQAKQPTRNKKKGFGTKLTMSQAAAKCSVCGEAQFKGDRFLGCCCLRDLAKHADAEATSDGFHITFDPEYWSRDDAALLMSIVTEGV